jgi:TPR repeat protein
VEGVQLDKTEAAYWIRRAAEQGLVDTEFKVSDAFGD